MKRSADPWLRDPTAPQRRNRYRAGQFKRRGPQLDYPAVVTTRLALDEPHILRSDTIGDAWFAVAGREVGTQRFMGGSYHETGLSCFVRRGNWFCNVPLWHGLSRGYSWTAPRATVWLSG